MKKLAYVWIYLATLIFHFSMLVSCFSNHGEFVGAFIFISVMTVFFLKTPKYKIYLPSVKFMWIYVVIMTLVTIISSKVLFIIHVLMLLVILDIILTMIKMSKFNPNL